jgi:hypothetical protein
MPQIDRSRDSTGAHEVLQPRSSHLQSTWSPIDKREGPCACNHALSARSPSGRENWRWFSEMISASRATGGCTTGPGRLKQLRADLQGLNPRLNSSKKFGVKMMSIPPDLPFRPTHNIFIINNLISPSCNCTEHLECHLRSRSPG